MMTSDDFTDVTLVSDDKQSLRAHRNVLSACSPVFKSIFQIEAKNNHPVLYLRGIKYEEMESIIQFIYLGEAHFHEERINEFLLVAKNLEIKELYKEDGEVSSVDISADLSKEKKNFEIKNLIDEDGEKSVNLSARSEVILKKSSNLYCMLELRRVLMVGTKVSKGFFV